MDPNKLNFAKKSLKKAEKFKDDPFVEFIIIWLGLNALYGDYPVRENKKLEHLFIKNRKIINRVLENNIARLDDLVDYICNTMQHNKLSEFIERHPSFLKNGNPIKNEDFAEFIKQVRNNMFHAAKLWDEEEEENLLKKLNLIIKEILAILTN